MTLTFEITLLAPPSGLTYAMQKGAANKHELVQIQTSNGGDLHFNLTAELKGTEQTNATPNFKGPFVQGPLGGRFIYINIGSYAGGRDVCSGRIKVPLYGITWADINKSKQAFKTTVPGTGKNGGPIYATVKPFAGWAPAA